MLVLWTEPDDRTRSVSLRTTVRTKPALVFSNCLPPLRWPTARKRVSARLDLPHKRESLTTGRGSRFAGQLKNCPASGISYEYVAQYLKGVFDQHRVAKIGFDRWNMQHLKPWLLNAGFSEQAIEDKFVGFGQGFKSMSPALRDLESIILEKKLR